MRLRRLFAAVRGNGPPVSSSSILSSEYIADGGRTGRDLSIRTPTRSLTVLLATGTLVVAVAAESAGGVPLPKPRPTSAPAKVGTNATTAEIGRASCRERG